MDTREPIAFPRPEGKSGTGRGTSPAIVAFNRRELQDILNLYGRMVVAGHWKDYAIDDSPEIATFSIYRRASEMPLFRIVKSPALARRQGTYAIMGLGGHVLKRGHSLPQLLTFFEKRRFELVE